MLVKEGSLLDLEMIQRKSNLALRRGGEPFAGGEDKQEEQQESQKKNKKISSLTPSLEEE